LITASQVDSSPIAYDAMHDCTEKGTHHEPHHNHNPTMQPTLTMNLEQTFNTLLIITTRIVGEEA
jgi:hypothetical protein